MNIFFDTEFLDLGDRVELLSLGAVRSDGAQFYMERAECPVQLANDWVQLNVIPILTGPVAGEKQLAAAFAQFCGPDPQFWAYYAGYDWWLLMQLYGGFMRMPPTFPQYCHEIKTIAMLRNRQNFPEQRSVEHHALNDALWNQLVYDYIMYGTEND